MSISVRQDRAKAAALIGSWLDSNISNWQFDDAWPWESVDLAVVDIGRELWRYFSDLPELKLRLSDLNESEKAVIDRCVMFLNSDETYEPVSYIAPPKGFIRRLLRLRKQSPEFVQMIVAEDRKKWWPFANESQYNRMLSQS